MQSNMFSPLVRRRVAGRIAFVTGLLVITTGACAAQNPTSGKHCLWRVTNARAPFYLLGTMHSLRLSDWKFSPGIEEAIRQSHQFWFEIDPNRGDLFTRKITAAARYPRGTLIKEDRPKDLRLSGKDHSGRSTARLAGAQTMGPCTVPLERFQIPLLRSWIWGGRSRVRGSEDAQLSGRWH